MPEELVQDNDEPGQPPSAAKTLAAPLPPASPARQTAVLSDEDIPPGASQKRASKPRRPTLPPLNSLPIAPATLTAAPSSAVVAQQAALPSNEDAPPPEARHKSTRKEELIIEEVNNQKANRELRGKYADKAYELASRCILFWVVVISVNAAVYGLTGKLIISDTAMIAITTGVTVNVLACFLGVIRGLFPSDHPQKKPDKKKSGKVT